jgi:hypothetical protein
MLLLTATPIENRLSDLFQLVSLVTLRFQEQEEAWVDARTGSVPSDRLMTAAENRLPLPRPDGPYRQLDADLRSAVPAVHELLSRRAAARQAALGLHASASWMRSSRGRTPTMTPY